MSNPNRNWNDPNNRPQGGWQQPPRPDTGPNPYGPGRSPYGPGNQGPGFGMPNPAPHVRAGFQHPRDMQRHVGPATDQAKEFTAKVFGWMAMGLGLTALVAWYTFSSGLWMSIVQYFWAFIIAEFALVIGLTFGINREKGISGPMAIGGFLLYAALNGVTLSLIFLAYQLGSIAQVFLITTMTFGFMAVYGYTTKKDLTAMGSLATMALIGIVIAMVVNFFLASAALDFVISIIGVLVFVGLTAWDAQKIKQMGTYGFADQNREQSMAVMGALVLYLDFINLFLFLLRLFGDRR